jgi:CheY-like chemotaxis protein
MTYLAGAAAARNGEASLFPCLVLLDLHLPGIPGLDVLAWIRAQPALTTLVVIVFSSSQDPRDLARAYRLRANSFVSKPAELHQRVELARMLKGWWLEFNRVPQTQEFRALTPVTLSAGPEA